MFVVELGSVLVTIFFVKDLGSSSTQENVFAALVAAGSGSGALRDFSEAIAEGRGKAQADEMETRGAETVSAWVRRVAGDHRAPRCASGSRWSSQRERSSPPTAR